MGNNEIENEDVFFLCLGCVRSVDRWVIVRNIMSRDRH